jgi:hypothetical protein
MEHVPNLENGCTMLSASVESALVRRRQKPNLLEQLLCAYHFWGTIGVDLFITKEGTFIKCVNENANDAVLLTDESEINAALAVGVANVPELASLLQIRPNDAVVCPICQGIAKCGVYFVCNTCKSRGWVAPPSP